MPSALLSTISKNFVVYLIVNDLINKSFALFLLYFLQYFKSLCFADEFQIVAHYDAKSGIYQETSKINWPHFFPPPYAPKCGFDGSKCSLHSMHLYFIFSIADKQQNLLIFELCLHYSKNIYVRSQL